MKTLLYIALLLVSGVADAARVKVLWTNPSKNMDGTVLTDLSYVIVEWGSCVGITFGTVQSSALIVTTAAGAAMSTYITPTGLSRVCVRVVAFNMQGANSPYSNTAFKDLLPTTGKPVTLGQPAILP